MPPAGLETGPAYYRANWWQRGVLNPLSPHPWTPRPGGKERERERTCAEMLDGVFTAIAVQLDNSEANPLVHELQEGSQHNNNNTSHNSSGCCQELLGDAEATAKKFKTAFQKFSSCHQVYSSRAPLTDEDLSELGKRSVYDVTAIINGRHAHTTLQGKRLKSFWPITGPHFLTPQ